MNVVDLDNLQLGITNSWTPNNIQQQQQHITLYAADSILEYGRLFVLDYILQFNGDINNSAISLLEVLKPLIADHITRLYVQSSNTIPLLNRVAGVVEQSLKFMHRYYAGLYSYEASTSMWQPIPKEVLASNWTLPQGNGFIDIMFNTPSVSGQLFFLSASSTAYQMGIYTYDSATTKWTLDSTISCGIVFPVSPTDGQQFYLIRDLDAVLASVYLDKNAIITTDITVSANASALFLETQQLVNSFVLAQIASHSKTQEYSNFNQAIPSLQ